MRDKSDSFQTYIYIFITFRLYLQLLESVLKFIKRIINLQEPFEEISDTIKNSSRAYKDFSSEHSATYKINAEKAKDYNEIEQRTYTSRNNNKNSLHQKCSNKPLSDLKDHSFLKYTYYFYNHFPNISTTINIKNYFPESVSSYNFVSKIITSKGKKIIDLGLGCIAASLTGSMLPLMFATAKIITTTVIDYQRNESFRAILDERKYLQEYIDATDRCNRILANNKRITKALKKKIISLITKDTEEEITKIYKKNSLLRRIFRQKNKEFRGKAEQIIFVQTLKIVASGIDNKARFSEEFFNEMKNKFSKQYNKQLEKFYPLTKQENDPVVLFVNDFTKKLVDASPDIFKYITEGFYTQELIARYFIKIISLAIGEGSVRALNEKAKLDCLDEIAILRLDGPNYTKSYNYKGKEIIGSYKVDLANKSIDRQIDAFALKEVAENCENLSAKEIKKTYAAKKAELKKSWSRDPRLNSSQSFVERFANISSDLVHTASPWSEKLKLFPKEPVLQRS